ncbi:hypothetical protein TYRP_015184 [Tyrophagus putrescentiae]|nr:hypothetical protein TYRP_015184 [Tyrophagus putrescentiae]
MHLLKRLLFLPRPSSTLDLIHRKALRTSSSSGGGGGGAAHPVSRFALSTAHYRVYLLWKGALYLYSGLLVSRFLLLGCVLFLDRQYSGSSSSLGTLTFAEGYTRADPVLGGLIFGITTEEEDEDEDDNFFHFITPFSALVVALLSSISLYLDLLLHFRLDLFTTQLFQEAVNLNGVHFWAVNRHLKRPPRFCLLHPLETGREISRWACQLWNYRADQRYCSFYFRRLRKYPHLSKSVRLKVMLVGMGLEKVVVVSVYSTLVICCGFALAYIYQLSTPVTVVVVEEDAVEEDIDVDLDDHLKYFPRFEKAFFAFLARYNRHLPPNSSTADVLLLAYAVFNAARVFTYLLYYLAIALFANVAHQAENQRKLRQLVAHCRRTATLTSSTSGEDTNANAEGGVQMISRTSRISRRTSNNLRTTISPAVPSTNGLLYSQNLAACLVFYYQERLFFLYACLRLNGLTAEDNGRKRGGKSKEKGGGGPVSGLLGACFIGNSALGAALLTPLFSGWFSLPWSRKLFLLAFFALQKAFFCSAVVLCSSASGWLHRSGRLLYSAQSILRPRANVVAVVAKLKLMTRFELVHTRRPFTFRMLWRSVGVRRELLYEYSLLYTAYLFALFKLINKRRLLLSVDSC